jgi:uncharacterized protein with HEPN domain
MLPADRIRLRHMLDAGKEAVAFLKGQRSESLHKDRKLLLAVVRSIEIIGEAAAHVSKPCQDASPQLLWPQIIAMRNRLIHAYFDVDVDRVWDTVQDDLPPLIEQLESILSQER